MADDETEWHLDDFEMARLDIVYMELYIEELTVFASCLRINRGIRQRAVFRTLMKVEVGLNEFHIHQGAIPFP